MKKHFLSLAIFIVSITTYGQFRFPDLSSQGSIAQNVGFTTLKINYERPSARGRKVFGALVPFNQLWRTGAGHCTKISFNQPVLLNNLKVNAGTYSVFSIPNEGEWTIIINRDTTLYGTSKYDSKKDVIRFNVKPQTANRFFEALSFEVDIVGNNAVIYLSWENTQVHFALQTFTDETVMNNITQNLLTGKSKDGDEYAGAVEYYLYNNKDLDEALLLSEYAIKNEGGLYSFALKIQVLEKQKRYAEAIVSAKQGLEFIKTNGTRLGYSDNDEKALETKIKELTEKAKSKPSPTIIGTPPPLAPDHNPYNDAGLVSQYIRSIFQDSKGNFWFGPAGQSVVRYDEKTLQYYSRAEFFQGNEGIDPAFNSVHAIAEDKQGNIWFGTHHGAIKYDGKTFRSYTEKQGLSKLQVGRKSILVDKAGTIWVGTTGGAFRYNPSADSFSLFQLLPPINVTDIMEDNMGNIWFASSDKGVFRYDPSATLKAGGKAITPITYKEGLGNNYAGGIVQDKTGNFWFTTKAGICRFDGKNFTEFTDKDGLGGTEIWGIYIEKSGIIWITARGSTTRFDPSIPLPNPKAFTVFTVADGINCCVQSMYQDRSGNMWWGTGQGLYRFDGQRFYQVKQNGPW